VNLANSSQVKDALAYFCAIALAGFLLNLFWKPKEGMGDMLVFAAIATAIKSIRRARFWDSLILPAVLFVPPFPSMVN